MRKQLYWLSDAEWRRIEPLMPRGRRGAHRVDDRRVISGIMHMLRSGARWARLSAGLWPLYDDLLPLQSLEPARRLERYFLCPDRLDRTNWDDVDRRNAHQSPLLGSRRKRGLPTRDRALAWRARVAPTAAVPPCPQRGELHGE
jgi:hypothetical protein